ncbi:MULTISPECIES: MFS transporter [Streptomyces]|uniref:MFS transporter n=2 Tax=Streptomyces rimosus subsp. rimosus TaxID=132474 RepID=A0A8A1UTL7_STRR1|nr:MULTISPECIES: MFS transporter [Streptomyces]KOG68408.1 MFS transporter [Kitasatospora aureofaciens]MYT46130.1 MFS transporter [Streptomyces sp. SID5471]KOT27671.1 MFS transporter [Streptomyces sp. NRRL WC-3701]KOT27795.1 MFS transporter [Streptomyces rimosus subsp. rimosus]KOT48666.1 MFS transporter [Streptomyces rimosus subsp. rimosus]
MTAVDPLDALDDPRRAPARGPAAVPADPPPGGVLGRTYRALTLGIISVVSLIAFEASAVTTAMPAVGQALDGIALYAFAFSAYFTASLFAMALSGEWCDRSGPLVPLFTGIATFGAGLVVAGCAPEMWLFVVGRGVQGIGGGLVIVALYVVVGRAYPEALRPSVLAAFSAAWVLPVIVGPLVAGTVTEQLGWRWVFLSIPVLVLLPLTVMLPALRKLPPRQGEERMDRRRILLALAVAAGAGLLQYAAQRRDWVAVLPAVAGLALLVPAVVRLLPRGTFRAARGLPSVVLIRGLAAGSLLAAESFIPLMLVTERGLSTTLAGLSLTGGGLTWALGSYTQSRPRLEPYRERIMGIGMLLMTAAILVVPWALVDGVPVWIVAVAWIVAGFGMGLNISSGSVLLLKLSPPEEAGSNSASLQVSDALGNITFVGISGLLFSAFGGGAVDAHATPDVTNAASGGQPAAFAAVFVTMAAVALTGSWVATRLKPARDGLATAAAGGGTAAPVSGPRTPPAPAER